MNPSHQTLAIKFLSAKKCRALHAHLSKGDLAQYIDGYTDTYIWLRFPSVEFREAMLHTLKSTVPSYTIIHKNQKEVIQVN